MGGLGKTTLARQVYNNEKIKAHFEERIWVYVSQNFDAVILFKKILESLTGETIQHGSSRKVLLRKIKQNLEEKQNLKAKRYLLVLDDVWNEETEKWDDFKSSLLGISSVRGHGIIVTTRSDKVSSIVETLPVHKLKTLSEDNCWSIIKAKAFREGDIPPEFETMGKIIAKRCQGLPLAAKVVGGLLLDKSENEWLSIQDTWLSNFWGDGSTVSKILKLSFDHLSPPSSQKVLCMLFDIPKGSKSICGSDNVLDEIHQARYMSLKCVGDESCAISKEAAKYVRVLLFEGKVFHDMLLDFKSLHVLILKGEDVEKLPISIGKLIHLRFLDISFTRIEYLPDPIGKLYYLQTLFVDEGYFKKLPNTLKHLWALEIYNLEKVCDKEDAKSAHLFQKPNIFKLKFAWSELREGEINDENVLEGLQPHPNLKSLEIEGFKGRNFPLWILKMVVHDDHEGRWIGLNHLREICLTHCKESDKIPMLGHLPHLKRLYLHDLTDVRSIDSSFYGIGSYSTPSRSHYILSSLEILCLGECPNLRSIPYPSGQQTHGFTNLHNLEVAGCEALTSLPSEMVASCAASLEILVLVRLNSLTNFAEVISHLPRMSRLTHLGVLPFSDSSNFASYEEFLDVFFRGLKSLRALWLWGHGHWDSLPDWLQNQTSLSKLEMLDFGIELFPEWFGKLTSLKKLKLWHCKKLKSLPSVATIKKLEIEIKDCPLLEQR
ncbi:UNVERIFIED_CONTAM: putative disease resistance protein RGA3 [Sesamum radiatum]|uniref:Disease resistance protein RGA3 n=1 Tax=Sesamum radiatum TaxID=300843 RepID=A0AAW2UEC2_SESRA